MARAPGVGPVTASGESGGSGGGWDGRRRRMEAVCGGAEVVEGEGYMVDGYYIGG